MVVPDSVVNAINNANSILLLTHQNPDGDAIGSISALGKGLKKLGKEVDYFVQPSMMDKLKFLSEVDFFNQNLKDEYDLIIACDTSSFDYLYKPEEFPKYKNLLVIDHHKTNENYGDYNLVEITGATGELMYILLEALGVELDRDMKEAIFTALSSDTGSFQFSNTTKQTHQICSKLYEKGEIYSDVSKKIHTTKSIEQIQMFSEALQRIELYQDGKIVLIILPNDVIESLGGTVNITDDISQIGMTVDSSVLSVFAKELEPERFKLSFRSKSPYPIDVSSVAKSLDGGGHERASGADFYGTQEELKDFILPLLESEVKKLN